MRGEKPASAAQVFVLLSLFGFALAGGMIWLQVRNGLDEDTEASG